ncbi:LsmAD domain-containing protein [Mycena sanguinolenta]|uniref:LsmAD domain-containing protein n=1 Tax=Mycena sanguinolenta TaxID=230812 RepID=A0A8H6ZFY3_9AGAR|nr:LsmAD domain-containing protein [Mycena sanguinolenta]
MASAARQTKPARKGPPEPARSVFLFSSPNYPVNGPETVASQLGLVPVLHQLSPLQTPLQIPPRLPQRPFPPLAGTNGTNGASAQDKVLQSLAGLTGTTITLLTKTAQRYEGVIASTSGEGDTPGVTLKDVKEITNPGGPLKDQLFIASTNIDTWASGPADAKVPNGDSFRTDADISQKKPAPRERELQAWQPSADGGSGPQPSSGGGDDETFGTGSKGQWDQFNANEKLFGVKTTFDEDAYTTKLDRNAPDFKERERKAQRIANEIIGAGTNNPHIAEERNQNVDDSGANEEDKYGAVVRGKDAYVPPGARKTGGDTAPAGNVAKTDIPKLAVNGPDGTSVPSQTPSKSPSPAPSGSKPNDPVAAFSDFVTNEKQRLQQKRQALVKSDMDKRMADLVKFSQSFKARPTALLNKPIPDDLVPILAKDEEKQRAIKEKSTIDAASAQARNIGASSSSSTVPGAPRGGPSLAAKISPDSGRKPSAPPVGKAPAAPPAAKGTAAKPVTPASAAPPRVTATGKPAISMVIQSIPPFRGAKARQSSQPTTNNAAPATGAGARPPTMTASATTSVLASSGSAAAPSSPNAAANAARLNVNASSFKPNPKANAFTPGAPSPNPSASTASASVSPKPKLLPRPTPSSAHDRSRKNTAAHIKDDFNPFKHNKVVEASQVSAMWPYNGKRYTLMFPQPPHQHPQPHSPHMQPPGPVPVPAPSYEEDPAAQAAQRGYVYAYPPYAYPPQMMPPGMVPPGPPGAYMGPYMQAMPYPPGMPPPNMYASPGMGQMPPPQAYMQPPPPGTYPPPPNGAGPRPSMPPTPIPAHAHPYYHQSPQLQHAVPYPMMMQPPNGPVHPYDPSAGVPVPAPMGGHA